MQGNIRLVFLCWLMHYAPFFPMKRALFLHHYLPSAVFSQILFPLILEAIVLHTFLARRLYGTLFLLFSVLAIVSFYIFMPFRCSETLFSPDFLFLLHNLN